MLLLRLDQFTHHLVLVDLNFDILASTDAELYPQGEVLNHPVWLSLSDLAREDGAASLRDEQADDVGWAIQAAFNIDEEQVGYLCARATVAQVGMLQGMSFFLV